MKKVLENTLPKLTSENKEKLSISVLVTIPQINSWLDGFSSISINTPIYMNNTSLVVPVC